MCDLLQDVVTWLSECSTQPQTSRVQLWWTDSSKTSSCPTSRANTWFCSSTPWICELCPCCGVVPLLLLQGQICGSVVQALGCVSCVCCGVVPLYGSVVQALGCVSCVCCGVVWCVVWCGVVWCLFFLARGEVPASALLPPEFVRCVPVVM